MTSLTEVPKNKAVLYGLLACLSTGVLVAGYITSDVWSTVFATLIKSIAA